ncbi:hypothetical protein ACRRTK_022087 [Alexandromys fortis]
MEFPHQEGPLKRTGGEGALVCTTANGTLTLRYCRDRKQQRALPDNYVLQFAETSFPKSETVVGYFRNLISTGCHCVNFKDKLAISSSVLQPGLGTAGRLVRSAAAARGALFKLSPTCTEMEGRLLRSLPAQQDCSIREKIDLEIRMREGIWKLLSLSTKKDQVLRAVKNLMVCHARIEAYTAELRKLEEQIASQTGRHDVDCESKERRPCRGRLALSDIRIPLMWKDSDHFSNKECTQRYAIFCLFRMGAEVFDTDMVIVDQTVTDICFDNVTIFHEAGPDFRIKMDVYSCGAEDSSIANTPKKLAKKLKTSISKAAGRKITSMLQEENQEACLLASSVACAKSIHPAHPDPRDAFSQVFKERKWSQICRSQADTVPRPLLPASTLVDVSVFTSVPEVCPPHNRSSCLSLCHSLSHTPASAVCSFCPLLARWTSGAIALLPHNSPATVLEDCSFWLPLYGNVCCRLVAQPACMAEDAFAGFLNEQVEGLTSILQLRSANQTLTTQDLAPAAFLEVLAFVPFTGHEVRKQTVKGLVGWRRLYCALRGGKLHCFYGPEEIEAKVEPTLVVSIDKETKIQAIEKDPRKVYHFSIVNTVAGRAVTHVFAAESLEDLQEWMGAFRQHFFDLSQWKHCCEELMKIEIMSPRKPPLFLTKEATSVYHDMSIDSPVKLESLTDIIQKKIGETNGQFLLGQDGESAPPPWAAVFDGKHEMVIQKKVVSPAGHPAPDGKRKKRRAPLPPTDQPPFSIKTQGGTDQPKDSRTQASISAASPSDPRLSSQMHPFQKPVAAPRKLPPARKNSSADGEHADTKTSLEDKPVPAPRQKSIRDILDPRSWLQTQV